MPLITPVWTDNVVVIASQLLARGSLLRATLDLRAKHGAYVFVKIGRTGGTALTNGVLVRMNRTLANDGIEHPGSVIQLGPGAAAAATVTSVNGDSAAGQNILFVGTLLTVEDYVLIGGGTAREEWGRVAATLSTPNRLVLDRPLRFTHTAAQADPVLNRADIYPPVWLQGGATWELIVDYADDTAGDSVRVDVRAQTYDADQSV